MSNLARKFYSPVMFDVVFALAGAVGAAGVVGTAGRTVPAIAEAPEPLTKGLALLAMLVAAMLLATQTTRLDQKCADDFTFHTLTKSAFMAIMAYVIGSALWQLLLARSFGGYSQQTSLAIVVATWSLTYFYTRWRGTRA